MEPIGGMSAGYGVFSGRGHTEAFQLRDEIHSLMSNAGPPENGNSFTALLGLPLTEALDLLRRPDSDRSRAIDAEGRHPKGVSFNCSPTIPADSAPVDGALCFSSFTEVRGASPENSPNPSVSGEELNQLARVKSEATDSDSAFALRPSSQEGRLANKRKEPNEKPKGRNGGKKSKGAGVAGDETEKLPYVHVRARRGQATDSHSLAERARREKINARMKLLQELVPGCNKISGTALVLDEIINHVQSLQRQVEFLSMRLASANPRIDFSIDSFLTSENGTLPPIAGNAMTVESVPAVWPEMNAPPRRAAHHQLWHLSDPGATSVWGRRDDAQAFVLPETMPTSMLGYGSVTSAASMRPNQVKMEM